MKRKRDCSLDDGKSITESDINDIKKDEFANKIANEEKQEIHRERERRKKVERMKRLRQDPSYSKREKEKNIQRITTIRQNLAYKEAEKEKDLQKKRQKRQNMAYKEAEKEKDLQRKIQKRQNIAYKKAEKEKNLQRITQKRQNLAYKEAEKEKNLQRIKSVRRESSYRELEKEKNVKRMKITREDTDYRISEQIKNRDRIIILREDFNFIAKKRKRDIEYKRLLRLDDFFRYREKCSNSVHNKIKIGLKDNEYYHNVLIMNFLQNRKLGPDIVCLCCENLFFLKSVERFNINKIRNELSETKMAVNEFINKIVNNSSEYVCKTCKRYITSGDVPKTAANTDLKFPNVPKVVTSLTALEERMVSPYIPFMQIKALQPYAINPQLSLKGSIVNVPVEINEMVNVLPRTLGEMSTIQIKLKRHLEHKSDYKYETIKPAKICEALEYLQQTPLYRKNNVNIDENFFKKYNRNLTAELEFIVDKNDKNERCTNIKKHKEKDPENKSDSEESEYFEPNDEVLIVDRNKEISTNIQIIAPGQSKYPIPWHLTENIDELCFPRIFGGEILDKRNKLTYSQRIKFEVRHKDRRSCQPTRILFMAKQKLEKSVMSNINICLRRVKRNNNLTAGEIKDSNFLNDSIRYNDGYKFLKQVRSSPSYWENKKKHLLSMIRQCGIPSLFFTGSACEHKNPDLLKILYKIRENKNISTYEAIHLDMAEKTKLIREDPVTCVRYIEERFNMIMSILQNEYGPLGENYVVDHFQRREFQARGTVHTHNLLYCKNAPIYDEENEDANKKLIQWIDKIITCAYDDKNPLIRLQIHRHKSTCYKGRKNKFSCRFNIPMFVMKETMILKPLGENEKTKNDKTNRKKIRDLMQLFFEKNILISFEDMLERLEMTEKNYIQTIRSTLSRTKIFLKRQSNEVAINAYNKTILTLLESNMDIQFVLDPYSCASYMINYVTKVDAGLSRLLKEAAKDLENGNLNIRQKFRKIANVFINGNTMSAQEAVYHVLGLPLSLCSRAVVYINTAPRKERVRMLKNDKHLKKISDESTDIYYKNIIDKYENRNYQKLPDVCLAEFAANYEEKRTTYQSDSENEYNENIEIRERKKQKIIRFRRYKLQEDRYNYFREQVLLFLPWKNETDDVETQNCETL